MHSIVVLPYISLMTSEVGQFFMCLLIICLFFLVKCLLRNLSIGFIYFLGRGLVCCVLVVTCGILELHVGYLGLPRWLSGKESTCQRRRLVKRGFDPWVGKIPWSWKQQPAPVFLLGECHGQSCLVGYSPWGHKESDMAEHACTCTQDL